MRIKKYFATLFLLFLGACLPLTTTKIEIGYGFNLASMDRVEVIFERIGFDLGQPREARTDRDGKISSAFETGKHQGFAVGCSFRPRDGYLEVVFVERNSSFSESGQKLLQQLRTELHREFGLQQIEVSPPAKDPAPTSPAG